MLEHGQAALEKAAVAQCYMVLPFISSPFSSWAGAPVVRYMKVFSQNMPIVSEAGLHVPT